MSSTSLTKTKTGTYLALNWNKISTDSMYLRTGKSRIWSTISIKKAKDISTTLILQRNLMILLHRPTWISIENHFQNLRVILIGLALKEITSKQTILTVNFHLFSLERSYQILCMAWKIETNWPFFSSTSCKSGPIHSIARSFQLNRKA